MFLTRLQKVFLCTERNCLRRALSFRNGMKNTQQHVKFVSNIQYPQKVVPDPIVTDFTAVQKVWMQNQDSAFNDFLFQCFEKESDCFSYAACLLSQACNNNKNTLNLAFSIINSLEHWQKNNSISQDLSPQVQSNALIAVLSSKNRLLIQLTCDVFRINSQCDFIDDIVENYLLHKNVEEAAICVIALKIQERYPIEKILLPVVLKGKTNLALMYIGEKKDMLEKLLKLMDDSLLQRDTVQNDKLILKRLSSLLSTLKIPSEKCPNLLEIRRKSTMNVLIRKRYLEKAIKHSYWEEMTMALLRDFPSLHKKLIRKLVDVKDFDTAVKMASVFKIPTDEWPTVLKNFVNNAELPDDSGGTEDPASTEVSPVVSSDIEHLSLPLEKSSMKYVETVEQFQDCVKSVSENYNVVGFDSEWKPCFGVFKSRLALMQLAVEDKVYLLDILALNTCLKKSHWDDLMVNLFGNPKILKLGCGLFSDVDILVKSYKGTVGVPIKFSRLLDVAFLFQKFQFACPGIFPFDEGNGFNGNCTLGLSKICAYVLGSPLKKEKQFSNWEVRPLEDSQLYYAALDAYCLLQIYKKLQEVAKEQNLDFEKLLHESIMLASESSKPTSYIRGRMRWSRNHEGFELQKVVPLKEIKFLLDPKLENLGRGLKNYGVDITFLETPTNCFDAVKLAKAENRIILACSLLCEQLKDLTADDRIYFEISEDLSDDWSSVAHIFQKFNIRFQADYISSPENWGI